MASKSDLNLAVKPCHIAEEQLQQCSVQEKKAVNVPRSD